MMRKVTDLVKAIENIEENGVSFTWAISELIYSLNPTKLAIAPDILRDAIHLDAAQRYHLVRELRSLFYIEGEEPLYSHETLGDGRDDSHIVYIFGDDGCVPLKTLNDEAPSLFLLMLRGASTCQELQDVYDLALDDHLIFDNEYGFRP